MMPKLSFTQMLHVTLVCIIDTAIFCLFIIIIFWKVLGLRFSTSLLIFVHIMRLEESQYCDSSLSTIISSSTILYKVEKAVVIFWVRRIESTMFLSGFELSKKGIDLSNTWTIGVVRVMMILFSISTTILFSRLKLQVDISLIFKILKDKEKTSSSRQLTCLLGIRHSPSQLTYREFLKSRSSKLIKMDIKK